MKSNYEVRAQKFLHQIFPLIEDVLCDPYCVEEAMEKFNAEHNRKVQVHYGEARIAIITSDYVIKFDYDYDTIEQIGGCENEIELYAQAVKDGFDYLFAKITKYNYKNHSFYIMPRIYGIGKYCNYYHSATYHMTMEEEEWCREHNLTDLHSNNYGFRKGKLCIVDYAYIEHDDDEEDEEEW